MERLIDLENRHLRLLRELLGTYLTDKTVWAYGSRVKWKADPASDLDLVVWNATDMEVANAKEAFVESNLPFTVQLLVWEDIPEDFKDNIRKKYVVLQEKTELAGWREVKLGKIVKSNQRSVDKNYEHIKIRYLDTGSICEGRTESYQTFELPDAPSRAKRLVKNHDIIYSTVRPIQRHYGFIKNPPANLVVSTGFSVIETDKRKAEPMFIYFFLTSNDTVEKLDSIAEGATSAYPSLRPSDIENLQILLPPLPEQKAIAQVLSSLDDKIDLLHRQNKTLENLAQTLFRQWFVEEADERWDTSALSGEFNLTMGQSPPGKSYNEVRQGTPLFQGNADFGFRFPKNRVYTTEPKRLAEKYDTLISVRAPVGELNMAQEKCCIGRGVASLRYKKNKDFYSYTYYKTKSLMGEIRQFDQEGTVFGSISKNDFGNIEIVLPPSDLIQKFQDNIKSIDERITSNSCHIYALENLRDTLLPKLMDAKVRVRRKDKQRRNFMSETQKLKLFISYCHEDEADIEKFTKHIDPLKQKGLIEDWYDRKILPGAIFRDHIHNNLEQADIICLFISAEFLASDECINEKKRAIELKNKKGISVVPIILKECGWKDDGDIFELLALPKDGKPVSSFETSDTAWHSVYEELKKVIVSENKCKQLVIKDSFQDFLGSAELLTRAHSGKETLRLDDIFIYPTLSKYDRSKDKREYISSEVLIKNITEYSAVLIAGENQSGKTTLCKKLFTVLREKGLVPVYVHDENKRLAGVVENRIAAAFKKQYNAASIDEIGANRIVPIIDDFHLATNKEKHINRLSLYKNRIIIVDDIFSLNLKDESLTRSFPHFQIEELKPSLRSELIGRWTDLAGQDSGGMNDHYENIDKTTELVDSILGKILGSGIMPAYPFFILSAICTYETLKPLNEEITSQGYCYQALIYCALRKQGIGNDEIDTYINFLTVFAFHFFKNRKREVSQNDYRNFMRDYLQKYNFPVKEDTLLKNLQRTQILCRDSLGNYSFCYLYLYYFFAARYIAEHLNECEKSISRIISNLHTNENAYIAVFVFHHSKNIQVLKKAFINADDIFKNYKPASLGKEELNFFDKHANDIVTAALPTDQTPERTRHDQLKSQDVIEEAKEMEEKGFESGEVEDEFENELRKGIKTAEVMGQIIKNRAGSLEKEYLKETFEKAMDIQLRFLSSFFELIREEYQQEELVKFISDRLEIFAESKKKRPSRKELEKVSRIIFWNINFLLIYGVLYKIVHSLGSDKLINIVEAVCDKRNTPASFIIKHGILMWYSKNLQIESIAERRNKKDFSVIARRILDFEIVGHSRTHTINYRDRQKIIDRLGILPAPVSSEVNHPSASTAVAKRND